MTEFLMSREQRKRKRAIYARAHRALRDLEESLSEMMEFACDLKDEYDKLEGRASFDSAAAGMVARKLLRIEIKNNGMPVAALISGFNNTREEI